MPPSGIPRGRNKGWDGCPCGRRCTHQIGARGRLEHMMPGNGAAACRGCGAIPCSPPPRAQLEQKSKAQPQQCDHRQNRYTVCCWCWQLASTSILGHEKSLRNTATAAVLAVGILAPRLGGDHVFFDVRTVARSKGSRVHSKSWHVRQTQIRAGCCLSVSVSGLRKAVEERAMLAFRNPHLWRWWWSNKTPSAPRRWRAAAVCEIPAARFFRLVPTRHRARQRGDEQGGPV